MLIALSSTKHNVLIHFGIVSADEGIVLNGLFDDKQIEEFCRVEFDNTIYQIVDGEFDRFMRKTGRNLYDYLNLKHCIIISLKVCNNCSEVRAINCPN